MLARTASGTRELDCEAAWALLDKNRDGKLTRAEIIRGCRSDQRVRELLQLPAVIRQEDGTRDAFEAVFQRMDSDDSKAIDRHEFHAFWRQQGYRTVMEAHTEAEAPRALVGVPSEAALSGGALGRLGEHARQAAPLGSARECEETRLLAAALREAEEMAAAEASAAAERAYAAAAVAQELQEARGALRAATEEMAARAMVAAAREVEGERLLEACGAALEAVTREATAMLPAEGGADGGGGSSGGADSSDDFRRAVASVEGRLQLEHERHAAQLERLAFENEELRRATKVKSEKIALLRRQLAEARGTAGGR